MAIAQAGWRARIVAVAERRLPALTRLRRAEPLPIRLDRRRIYVVPSGFGFAFAVLLFVMLLGALNYGNNPAVLLSCVLAATAGASLFSGFRAMSGVELVRVRAAEAHAGEPLPIHLRFEPGLRARRSLRVRFGGVEHAFSLDPARTDDVTIVATGVERGWYRVGRLRVWTDYPLGLFDLWSWLNPDVDLLVYPAIESPAPPMPLAGGERGERDRAGDSEDHAGLRDYRPSDPPRLIAWKASSRHDALLVRDVEHRSGEILTLDYDAVRGLGREARIRRLAAWVIEADARALPYALALPGDAIDAGRGDEHRRRCLRALALLPTDAPAADGR